MARFETKLYNTAIPAQKSKHRRMIGIQNTGRGLNQLKPTLTMDSLCLDFIIAPLWKSGVYTGFALSFRNSVILWFRHSDIIQMKLEYLWDQLANVDQILYEALLGWGKGCIRFRDKLDQNPGFVCSSISVVLFDTPGSPGVCRNTFLSSPHLCFIIVFMCDLFVSRDDHCWVRKPSHRPNKYVLSHDRSRGRGWVPVKPV